ncbi:MAG: GAF domain-containing protein [bacterium]|nr:GAF domain-containing protein [bacterium]
MDDARSQLIDNVRIAISEQNNEQDVLKAAVGLIDQFSEDFDWTGFYLLKDKILEVGPYVGPETPHTRIELGKGICGAAATEKKAIIVDNVQADSRFLACSLTTKSEIVVPLMDGDKVIGEIDIDSNQPSFFKEVDRLMLEAIANVIVNRLRELT